MRRILAASVIVVMPLLGITACGDDNSDNSSTAVCVDGNGVRVDDSRCGNGSNPNDGYLWFYIMSRLNQPSVGTQITHNHYYIDRSNNPYAGFKPPKNVTVQRAVPPKGWVGPYKPSSGNKYNQKLNPPKYNQPKPYSPPKIRIK